MQHHKSEQPKIKSQKRDGQRKKRLPKKITATYLHNSGLYYLERFSASKKHFISVMLRKVKRSCMHHQDQNYEECVQLAHELADKFEKSGLLNDDLYTDGMVSSMRRRGLSQRAIVTKMQIKGIDQDKTRDVLETHDTEEYDTPENAEMRSALKLARKKKIGPYFTGDEENIQRSLGMFARAGFSYQISKTVLDMTLDEAEERLMSFPSSFLSS